MSLKEKAQDVKQVFKGDKSLNRSYVSYKSFLNDEAALEALQEAKARMFNVNSWKQIPGPENADFILYDKSAQPSGAVKPATGDFIKTLLPGSLPEDWVQVVAVRDEPEYASFTVRPCGDPTDKDQSEIVTEHFFKSSATSTFKVEREGNVIKATEMGVNESINNEGPEAGDRKMLNTAISEAGWTFVQKMQWKNVTDYIVGNIKLKEG